MELNSILIQEERLTFRKFTHEFALQFGLKAIEIVNKRKLKRIGIRCVYDGLLVFQYLMDGKNDDMWLRRKEKTVIDSGHSSMYVFLNKEDEQYISWHGNDSYVIGGGGFPIIEEGVCRGAICISGLMHVEDHELIVEILEELL
nr:heme-binding protein [uncultured Clostridium sp.]